MRIKRSKHQRLAFVNRRPFRTVKLYAVTVDSPSGRRELWLNQDTFKVGGGFQFVGLKNNGATSGGIIANFSNGGIKARHKNG